MRYLFLLIVFSLNIFSVRAEFTKSYSTSKEEELRNQYLNFNFYNKLNHLRTLREEKKNKDLIKLKTVFRKKENNKFQKLNSKLYQSYQLKIVKYVREHEERVDLAVDELNKRILANSKLDKSGQLAEADYVLDLRKKQNGLAFLNDTKASTANVKVKKLNSEKKIQFYVLLNMFYPENEAGVVYDPQKKALVTLKGKNREEYLKTYTEAVFKRSNLSAKGVLLNVESVIIAKPIKGDVKYEIKYEPYIAYGRELSNSTLDKLLTEQKFLIDKGASQYQFAVPGTSTNLDSNKEKRATILDNYIDRISEIMLNNASDLSALENPEYLVRLKKLNSGDKEALRTKIKTANLSPYIAEGIEDYAGAKEYLQRFLIDDLSIWKAANNNIKLSIVTTSHKNTSKGKTARQVIKEKSVQSNEMLLGMHFIEVNGEIEIHWAAKYGTDIDYLEGIRLDELWNEISALTVREEFERQFGEYISDADYGFSQVLNLLSSISTAINDKKIPQSWYEGNRSTAFLSGMVNGLLTEVADIPTLMVMVGESYKTVKLFKVQLVHYAFKYCFNEIFRQELNSELERILDNRDDIIRCISDAGEKLADSTWEGAKKIPGMVGVYFTKLGQADWLAFYEYGFIVEQVATMFIGLGELSKIGKLGGSIGKLGKAFINTAKGNWNDAVKILDEMAEAGKSIALKLDNAIDDLYKASLDSYKTVYKSAWNITGVLLTYTSHATVYLIKFGKDQTKRSYTAFTEFLKSNLAKKEAKELLNEAKGKEYYDLLEDIYVKVDNKEYFSKLVKNCKDPYKLKNFLSDLLAQSDKASVHALIKRIPEKNIGDFIDDFGGNKELLGKFAKDKELVDSWKVLFKGNYRIKIGALEMFKDPGVLASMQKIIEEGKIDLYPNIPIEELTSIWHYSTNAYSSLNTALRIGNPNDYFKSFEELLNNGLSKLQKFNGEKVFRGVKGDEAELAKTWAIGDNINFKDFKSTSSSSSVANDFAGDVVYEISNPKGYNICGISCLPGEAEVLFKSGSKFKVKDIKPNFVIYDLDYNPFTVRKVILELIDN